MCHLLLQIVKEGSHLCTKYAFNCNLEFQDASLIELQLMFPSSVSDVGMPL